MTQTYSRLRVVAVLLIILVAILADHLRSPTFAMNMGQGGLETTLSQRESQVSACAPCGAPCPSTR